MPRLFDFNMMFDSIVCRCLPCSCAFSCVNASKALQSSFAGIVNHEKVRTHTHTQRYTIHDIHTYIHTYMHTYRIKPVQNNKCPLPTVSGSVYQGEVENVSFPADQISPWPEQLPGGGPGYHGSGRPLLHGPRALP